MGKGSIQGVSPKRDTQVGGRAPSPAHPGCILPSHIILGLKEALKCFLLVLTVCREEEFERGRFLVEKRQYNFGVLSASLLLLRRDETMCCACLPGGFPFSDKSLFHLWIHSSMPSSNCFVKPFI